MFTADQNDAYIDELREGAPLRLRIAAALGTAAFMGFAIVDPLLVDDVRTVLIVRVFIVLATLALLGASFVPSMARLRGMEVFACYLIGGGVVVLTLLTGGGNSPYHQALLLTFLGFAVSTPWSGHIAALAFTPLLVVYDLLCVGLDLTGAPGIWVTKNAVLWTCVLISVVIVVYSERGRREAFANRWELAAANERLKALAQAKSRFFANLSHELRTPLTLALAPVQVLLEDTRLSRQQREHLRIVERNGLRLLRRVDDLLELSKLEASEVRLRIAPLALASLLRELVEQIRPLAARKRIVLHLALPDSSAEVDADRSQLEPVLLNLLGNALKFTPPGGSVHTELQERDGVQKVLVRDTGPGIPEEHLDRVFERFYQVDDSPTAEQGGTGIGLALAREVITLHGGTIGAECPPEGGALVYFTLPSRTPTTVPRERRSEERVVYDERRASGGGGLPEWHQELRQRGAYRLGAVEDATERRIVPRTDPSKRPATVLVVEDNPDLIRFIASLLTEQYAVLAATDGEMGLRLARERVPDLIITDLMMPKLNGMEMVRQLRADPATENLPIIMLTAHKSMEQRVEAHSGGADVYLTKPFNARELLALVARLLRRQEEHLELAAQDRDASLRVMARGVAHEVLNPLGFILNALVILKEESSEDPEIQEIIRDAYKAGCEGVERVRSAVDELRRFAGEPTPEPEPLLLTEIVHRVVGMVGRGVEARYEDAPTVMARPGELERVLLNLLLNARQAADRESQVLVTVRLDDQTAQVIVADNGPGIDPEALERIFDPFYTTKEKNTGLGLAISRQIVRRHEGYLSVSSRPGQGATFIVNLPTAEPEVAE